MLRDLVLHRFNRQLAAGESIDGICMDGGTFERRVALRFESDGIAAQLRVAVGERVVVVTAVTDVGADVFLFNGYGANREANADFGTSAVVVAIADDSTPSGIEQNFTC